MAQIVSHAARKHFDWTASATDRNSSCPKAYRMCMHANAIDKPIRAGAWGTACHQLAELLVKHGGNARDHRGDKIVVDDWPRPFPVDDEMVWVVQAYVDYIRSRIETATTWTGEHQWSLAPLDPPIPSSGGTSDWVGFWKDTVVFPADPDTGAAEVRGSLVEVVDLKSGKWQIEEANNPQQRTYLALAVANLPDWRATWFRVTIAQPRDRDGNKSNRPIRSETLHITQLMDWLDDLFDWMEASLDPDAPFNPTKDNCLFCPANGFCPGLQKSPLEALEGLVMPDGTLRQGWQNGREMTAEKIAERLDRLDKAELAIAAFRAFAHGELEANRAIPGWKLKPKRATRVWDMAESLVEERLAALGAPADKLHTRKLVSPAQAEKLVMSKDLLRDMWTAESTGNNMVRDDDETGTEEGVSMVDKFFDKA